MKKTIVLPFIWCCLLLAGRLNAQYLLLDDMEGNGPCSGRWTYYAGAGATGKVEFNVPNPNPSGLNTSSHVAKFTKDTTCFEYMSAGVNMLDSFDILSNSTFKMLVYSTTTDDIMFKLQPGSDYTKAVYFTYRVSQINRWEEASFNFQSVKNRTDFNRVEVHYIDGKKANGILYFDYVQAPNPTGITLIPTNIAMGQEDSAVIQAKLNGDVFKPGLNTSHWTAPNLPPGVSIGNVVRINDTIANIILSGNSPANYSRTLLQLTVDSSELSDPNAVNYAARGNVVFDGNPEWTMVYQDEFSTPGLPDRAKWTVDPRPKGWINGEQQVYTDTTHDNIRVENGTLIIKGKKDYPNGNATEPWSSGRLISQNKMDFTYGKVEVRAKLPRARGSWPAIWLMPTSSAYGAWPRSGEIDIMEHVGNNFGTVLSTVHTQNNNWTNGGHLSATRNIPDADTVFHNYILEWTPDSLRFVYDSTHCYTYVNPHTDWKDWPFDQKFHVILNVAIGGGMGGSIVDADWPDSMIVDYVRVYQKGLGTPVLDTVIVTPADMSLLPGKTQQYSAKALDQNGQVMSILPVWTVSGAGNTIDSTGLATIQSSGIVTATATVDSVTVAGHTNVNVRPTNYKPVPARIEAEQFDNSNVCCTEPASDAGGGLNVSYIGANTWMEYDLDIPDSAAYRIKFRVAVSYASSLKVQLDTSLLTTLKLPASGGWQNWITVSSVPVIFGPGQKTIRVTANASGWNFNWLEIVPADSVQLDSIAVSPSAAQLILGDSLQFTATGYDQQGDYMALSPSPIWLVSGTGNTISPDGLLHTSATGQYTITAAASNTLFGQSSVDIVPVPVLTRIELSPDTVVVPAGASQQFTATGYDQNDSTIAFTPVWTAGGTGNTIASNGVFTAGSTPGTYTVTVSGDSISSTAVAVVGYTCSVNNQTEAETASSYASGPYLQACTDTGGGQNFAGLAAGQWFAYSNLSVPVAGRYNIRFRVLSTSAARIKIGHSGLNFGEIDIPSTGGVWKTISDTITLPALTYTGVHVLSGTFKFNWFSIDNCAEAPRVLSRIELSPSNAAVAPGETQQFTATGYDAEDEEMTIPSPVWSITGTGNAISATGLVTADTVAGTYTVTLSSDTVLATANFSVMNCTVRDKYEAESASNRHPGPYLQTCTDIGGGQNFAGLYTGHWFAYDALNVPDSGLYTISLRVSSTTASQVRIGHSSYTFAVIDIPSTGGAWQTIKDTLTLPALSYTGIHVLSGSFKFNWFSLDNCEIPGGTARGAGLAPAPLSVLLPDNESSGIRVYPNPTEGAVAINLDRPGYHTITLTDISGRVLRRWTISRTQRLWSVDLGPIKSGLYVLTLEGDGNRRSTVKVLKR